MTDGSKNVSPFWRGIYDDLDNIRVKVSPFFAAVGDVTGGLVRVVKRGETYDPGSAQLLQLSRLSPSPGDPVLMMTLADGNDIVLGRIQQGDETPAVTPTRFFTKAQAFINATTTSTTSTTIFSEAINLAFSPMPAGTYKVAGLGGVVAKHTSAGANFGFQLRAVGSNVVTGTLKTPVVHAVANTEMRVDHADELTGITVAEGGTITIYLEYRANTAGTISVRNASLMATLLYTGI